MTFHVCEDLASLSCPESRSMSFIMGNANSMRYTGAHWCLCCPWIPLYPDRDVVATQMTKAVLDLRLGVGVQYMQVLTTLGISLPHLALFDIIDSFHLLLSDTSTVHQSQLPEGGKRLKLTVYIQLVPRHGTRFKFHMICAEPLGSHVS